MDPLSFVTDRVSALDVDQFEIYETSSRHLQIEAKEGEVETSEEAVEKGLALRLFKEGKVGFASASGGSEGLLERMVSLAYHTLQVVAAETSFELEGKRTSTLHSVDRDGELAHRSFDEKAALALSLEREAIQFDRRITRVRGACYLEWEGEVVLKNSLGFEGRYSKTVCELSLMAVAEEKGGHEMAWESEFSPFFQGLDPSRPARRAAGHAVSLLGAKPLSTRKAPVLLEPQVGSSFLGILASSFLGDQVARGKSMLKDRLGEEIYSREVSLIDDGTLPGGFASTPFDGEGSPSERTPVVQAGRLIQFLQDKISSASLQKRSTGNGVRSGYRERPKVGVTNFFIPKGSMDPETLLQEMGNGLWITDVIGMHTANPVTGDFSLGAQGFWVEKGKRRPVKGIAISGNLHDVLKKTVRVGSDLRFYHSYGCPSLLVSELDIGGV